MKWFPLVIVMVLSLLLAACAASGGGGEPAVATEDAGPATQPEAAPTEPETAPAEPEATPTAEMSDVPVFEGAEDYKTTGNGTYITYNVPDTTVEIVTKFYQEQLAALGWEQKNKKDSGFGGSITILRVKPDKNISVTIDTNVVNNGVRVLITLIPK